jgi:hypothetical protein
MHLTLVSTTTFFDRNFFFFFSNFYFFFTVIVNLTISFLMKKKLYYDEGEFFDIGKVQLIGLAFVQYVCLSEKSRKKSY